LWILDMAEERAFQIICESFRWDSQIARLGVFTLEKSFLLLPHLIVDRDGVLNVVSSRCEPFVFSDATVSHRTEFFSRHCLKTLTGWWFRSTNNAVAEATSSAMGVGWGKNVFRLNTWNETSVAGQTLVPYLMSGSLQPAFCIFRFVTNHHVALEILIASIDRIRPIVNRSTLQLKDRLPNLC
jgi:hypothetical protein